MRGQMQKTLINRAINIIASIGAKLRNTPPRNIRLKMLLPQLLAPRCQVENVCCLLHSQSMAINRTRTRSFGYNGTPNY